VSDLPCACTALRKAARAVNRFYDDALAPCGVTTAQFAVLRNLARLGDAPLSRLADALVMDRTSLYRALQPLIGQGWVEVIAGSGRAKLARLTDSGQAAIDNATPAWLGAQAQFIDQFGAEAWSGTAQDLIRVVETASALTS